MQVRYYVFLSDESLFTGLYENGNRLIKVSAMFQLICIKAQTNNRIFGIIFGSIVFE